MTVNATANNPAQIPSLSRSVRRDQIKPEQFSLPPWTHPEVRYAYTDWKLIRDACAGEREVKAEGRRYLPKFDGMTEGDYVAYRDSATYYAFTGRTVNAMSGTIFKRRPVFTGVSPTLKKKLRKITLSNNSFQAHSKFVTSEILKMGRHGVLVDYPAGSQTDLQPYIASYIAENILDWATATDPVSGRTVLSYLVLREFVLGRNSFNQQTYFARYRVYRLEPAEGSTNAVCTVQVYERLNEHADLTSDYAGTKVVIKRRGQALDFIPFRFFGAQQSEPFVELSPIRDIAFLNMSHYRSYAHLEHGRFYTGFPIYTVEGDVGEDSAGSFAIGPAKVWLLPQNGKANLLEFNGQGLKFLETALEIKEAQAAALGGRMIGVTSRSVSESDNQAKFKERNEQALLLDVAQSLDEGYTIILQWLAWMGGATKEQADAIEVEFNKDFTFDLSGAREFRAIHQMYKDGVIPVDVFYDYLRKHEVIPDWMNRDEFVALCKKAEQFPNQPDFLARQLGYPDKKTQLEAEQFEEELAQEEQAAQLAATQTFNNDPGNREPASEETP